MINQTAPPSTQFHDFAKFKTVFTDLNSTFQVSVVNAQINARRLRRLEVDPESTRQVGNVTADGQYIPVRIIDRNVSAKMPMRIQYLRSSNRLALFTPEITTPETPTNVSLLESEFWRVMTYENWELPYITAADGAEFVGWNWFEVLYTPEEDRPGHVSINHVGRENLMFDMSVKDLQDSKLVIKRIPITLVTLRDIAKEFKFQAADVIKIAQQVKEGFANNNNIEIDELNRGVYLYRVFWKANGVVWTSWTADDIDHWLNPPHEFYNGVDVPETEMVMQPGSMQPTPKITWKRKAARVYPFYPLVRSITEDERISMTQGSADTDYGVQEASCALFSQYVLQANRSGILMGSPKNDSYDKTGAPKQLSFVIQEGTIVDRPFEWFVPPAPNPEMTKAIDRLEQLNADSNNQIAWGVNNRKDSNKTATEIASADSLQMRVNSADTFVFSIALRATWNAAWPIIQSQALQGNIIFLPFTDGREGNNVEIIGKKYRLKAAGEVDFVEKQQMISNMQQDMPIFQNTPVMPALLEKYLRLRYPDDAEQFIAAMHAQPDPAKEQLKQLLVQAVQKPDGTLDADFQPHQEQLKQVLAS